MLWSLRCRCNLAKNFVSYWCCFELVSISACKNTKKLKNLQILSRLFAKFAHISHFLYLCSVKRIEYICPIDYMRGSLSGRQNIAYSDGRAYDVAVGEVVPADSYTPIMVAQVQKLHRPSMRRIFQIRSKTSVHMTAAVKRNLALMGGVGALYASLLSDKTAAIYGECVAACPSGKTLRAFVTPLLRAGLAGKNARITIADGVYIVNPWISSDTPNVPVSAANLDKFASELGA